MTLTREQIERARVELPFMLGTESIEPLNELCTLALQGLDAQAENERLREWQNEIERRDDIIKSESALRLEHEKEELRLLRRIEGLIADNQKLREALEMASRAISNWVCLYAPDECAKKAVKAALVDTKDGVLGYTAEIQGMIRVALEQEPKPC